MANSRGIWSERRGEVRSHREVPELRVFSLPRTTSDLHSTSTSTSPLDHGCHAAFISAPAAIDQTFGAAAIKLDVPTSSTTKKLQQPASRILQDIRETNRKELPHCCRYLSSFILVMAETGESRSQERKGRGDSVT